MSLTLRQLEVFLAAAQDCNFRRTAYRLGVSQPSVSGRIKSLEAYLGYELFDRANGASPRLTHQGRSFIEKADELMSRAIDLAAPRRHPAGTLHLRALVGPLLLRQRVIPALPAFCREHPQVNVEFTPLAVSTDGTALVRDGEADVFLYTGDPPDGSVGPELAVEIIGPIACSIFGTPALVERVGNGIEALSAAPFLLPPDHHRAGTWIRHRLEAVGIHLRNLVAREQFPDIVVQMMLESRALSVFFDEFLCNEPLVRTGPPLEPASRIMVLGPRVRQPVAAPLLQLLRRLARNE